VKPNNTGPGFWACFYGDARERGTHNYLIPESLPCGDS
jgi:hypothetical protein